MRVLQCYRFLVGTKIPFDQWPGIIEEYLYRQNLTHRIFHYCLKSFDNSDRCRAVLNGTKCETCGASGYACERCRKEAADTLRKGTGCERAFKENPFMGAVKVQPTRYETIQYLNNFDDESNGAKENFYDVLSKIYRRYGFAETSIIYRDIDFFFRRVSTPAPEAEFLMNGYEGSGITLYRGCLSQNNTIILVVESCFPGEVPDAAPYADALGELLPGIKRLSATKIIMEGAEQAYYEELHSRAKPMVQQAKNFFAGRMPQEKGNTEPASHVSVASWLRKLSKRYGYTYLGYSNYVYFLDKRLPDGHWICLEFLSNPLSPDADPFVTLCGLGFRYEILSDGFSPQNPRDACEYLTRLFDVLAEAEQTVFPAILNLYPATPNWFMPAH